MALPQDQTIIAGAAQLLVTDAPSAPASTGIVTNVNNASSPAYTALDTEIVVDDAATLCPDVFDANGTGSIGDPPVIDVICAVGTQEVMFCYQIEEHL